METVKLVISIIMFSILFFVIGLAIWFYIKEEVLKRYLLINRNGDCLVSYKPGQVEMLSKRGFNSDGQVSYYEKEILEMRYIKALKTLSQITNEGFEIFLYKRKYQNVYFRVAA